MRKYKYTYNSIAANGFAHECIRYIEANNKAQAARLLAKEGIIAKEIDIQHIENPKVGCSASLLKNGTYTAYLDFKRVKECVGKGFATEAEALEYAHLIRKQREVEGEKTS